MHRSHRDAPHAVYRLKDAQGRTLYVGASHDPLYRFGGHRATKPWAREVVRIDVEWFPDKPSAFAAEAAAIRSESPIHNPHKPSPKLGSRLATGNGHLFLGAWAAREGVDAAALAPLIGVSVLIARRLLDGEHTPQQRLAERITLASEGYVPLGCWERPPRQRPFGEVSAEEAQRQVTYVRNIHRVRAGRAPLSAPSARA